MEPCRICPGFWCLIRTMTPLPLASSAKRRTVMTEHHVRFSDPRTQPRRVHSSAEDGQRARSAIRRVGVTHAAADRASHRSPSGAARDRWLPGSSSSCWCSRGRRTRPTDSSPPPARPHSSALSPVSTASSVVGSTVNAASHVLTGTLAQRPRARAPPARAPAPQAPAAALRTLPPRTAPGMNVSRAPAPATRARARAGSAASQPGTAHSAPDATQTARASPARAPATPPSTQRRQEHRPLGRGNGLIGHGQLSLGFGRRPRERRARPVCRDAGAVRDERVGDRPQGRGWRGAARLGDGHVAAATDGWLRAQVTRRLRRPRGSHSAPVTAHAAQGLRPVTSTNTAAPARSHRHADANRIADRIVRHVGASGRDEHGAGATEPQWATCGEDHAANRIARDAGARNHDGGPGAVNRPRRGGPRDNRGGPGQDDCRRCAGPRDEHRGPGAVEPPRRGRSGGLDGSACRRVPRRGGSMTSTAGPAPSTSSVALAPVTNTAARRCRRSAVAAPVAGAAAPMLSGSRGALAPVTNTVAPVMSTFGGALAPVTRLRRRLLRQSARAGSGEEHGGASAVDGDRRSGSGGRDRGARAVDRHRRAVACPTPGCARRSLATRGAGLRRPACPTGTVAPALSSRNLRDPRSRTRTLAPVLSTVTGGWVR